MSNAANCCKYLKTLRHPYVVKFYDSAQKQDQFHFITERVYPIKYCLEKISLVELITGFYAVLKFMEFMHGTCNLVHCMLNENAIFLNEAGEFRIGGFDFCAAYSNDLSSHFRDISNTIMPHFAENLGSLFNHPQSIDALFFHELFQALLLQLNREFLDAKGELEAALRKMAVDARRGKFDFSQFVNWFLSNSRHCSKFIATSLFFDEYFGKTREEKDIFLTGFTEYLDTFSHSYLKYKVFPILCTSIESQWSKKEFISCEIYLLLRIASFFGPDEYEFKALPLIVKLFQLPDRGVRMLLLKCINQHYELIPKKTMNDPIYGLMVSFLFAFTV